MRPSHTAVQRVFESGETLVTTDAQSDPRFNAQLSVRLLNLRSIICVPLTSKARRIGVVYLDSRVTPGLFTPQDPSLLLAFANQAALAIENARLFNDQRAQLREIVRLEELQAKVLASITNGVITVDGGGTITTFNAAAGETFGIPAAFDDRPARSRRSMRSSRAFRRSSGKPEPGRQAARSRRREPDAREIDAAGPHRAAQPRRR